MIRRFRTWLGTWRGRIEFTDGRSGIMQFKLSSIFSGEAIQVETSFISSEDGRPLNRGWGYLSLDASGQVVNNMYSSELGFAVLKESPDDPGVLSVSGGLSGNEVLDVAMSVVGDEFTVSSHRREGYSGHDDRPRTYAVMKRIGLTMPENP